MRYILLTSGIICGIKMSRGDQIGITTMKHDMKVKYFTMLNTCAIFFSLNLISTKHTFLCSNYNAMLVHNNAIMKEGEIIYLLYVFWS